MQTNETMGKKQPDAPRWCSRDASAGSCSRCDKVSAASDDPSVKRAGERSSEEAAAVRQRANKRSIANWNAGAKGGDD